MRKYKGEKKGEREIERIGFARDLKNVASSSSSRLKGCT
jgi:hypothetical protein